MTQKDIQNKQERMALIQRFLDAETSAEEEKLLADYFSAHQPEANEREVALLLGVLETANGFEESVEDDLSDAFEAVVQSHEKARNRRRPIMWLTGIAASLLLLFAIGKYVMQGDDETLSTLATVEKQPVSQNTAPSLLDSTARNALGNDTCATPMKFEKSHRTRQNAEPKRMKKAMKERLSTPEMIGQIRFLADIALQKDEAIEIIPMGNAAVVASADAKTDRVFLAFPDDDDGNMQLFALEDE